MEKSSDILQIHSSIMSDYKEYVSSFINIKDDRIREYVEKEIASGKFWPEPLIQFNPSFEQVGPIDDLCNRGILNRVS